LSADSVGRRFEVILLAGRQCRTVWRGFQHARDRHCRPTPANSMTWLVGVILLAGVGRQSSLSTDIVR